MLGGEHNNFDLLDGETMLESAFCSKVTAGEICAQDPAEKWRSVLTFAVWARQWLCVRGGRTVTKGAGGALWRRRRGAISDAGDGRRRGRASVEVGVVEKKKEEVEEDEEEEGRL